MSGPTVVAIGGGHGTAVTLRAATQYASTITAIVSVADDGGSSGRLRELLGIPALGDLRKCLVALAPENSVLAETMEHRYQAGELAGHAVGNLLLAGLLEVEGDLVGCVQAAADLLGAQGRVLPASSVPTHLMARGLKGTTHGQVAISEGGVIAELAVLPESAPAPAEAVEAILAADQVVIGPGSLYTSVLAAAIVPEIRQAIKDTTAQRVYVCNLRPQIPETQGFSAADHLQALRRHGIEIDVALYDETGGLALGVPSPLIKSVSIVGSNTLVHEPGKLAQALLACWKTTTVSGGFTA